MTSDNKPLEELPTPRYSKEECEKIVQYLMSVKSDLIRGFLASHNILVSGKKQELRERVEQCLKDEELEYKDLVNFIDTVAPCGKQHIILYEGPESQAKKWKTDGYVNKVLKEKGLSEYLNARLPLILPEVLTISSITYKPGEELKVYAVERRDDTDRREDLDKEETIGNEKIEFRAYAPQVTRGVVIFTWDFLGNTAMLQISQLPSGSAYEGKEEKFAGLINGCLDMNQFEKIDIRRAVKKLNQLEAEDKPEARSHSIGYHSPGGRKLDIKSPSLSQSVLGESAWDHGLGEIRKGSIGHSGNFYWLESSQSPVDHNPLEGEVHTIIVGSKSRINFTTPNRKEDIEYVLSRVRALSK
ncbi:MAG: hypothetical protein HY762_06200 [Planctomycetes bacterium]|nr:hypothetical protein [Planctomycetota bacterium]